MQETVWRERASALCNLITDLHVTDWDGEIHAIEPAAEKLSVTLTIGSDIWLKTNDQTLVRRESEIYWALSRLKRGDKVHFSGWFLPHEDRCLQETSAARWQSMRQPEFAFVFEQIVESSSGLIASTAAPAARPTLTAPTTPTASPSVPTATKKEPDTPEEVVTRVINLKDAAPTITVAGSKATVSYSLDPWLLTGNVGRWAFLSHVADIVPSLLEKFSNLDEVEIRATGTFVDVRGNEKVATAALIVFTRANAATIRWAGINQENLPKIADRAVLHPLLWKK